jgi:hypothetical protein
LLLVLVQRHSLLVPSRQLQLALVQRHPLPVPLQQLQQERW